MIESDDLNKIASNNNINILKSNIIGRDNVGMYYLSGPEFLGPGAFIKPAPGNVNEIPIEPLNYFKPVPINPSITPLSPPIKVEPVKQPDGFGIGENIPWLGLLGGYIGGNTASNAGRGLSGSGDLSWWGRLTQAPGEGFKPGDVRRPRSTTKGALIGTGIGLGLDYGLPATGIFGEYPKGTATSQILNEHIRSGAKYLYNKGIVPAANWVGDQVGKIFK